jgi:hypothetical protein
MANFYNPDWWDKWNKKNLRKKKELFNKIVRETHNKQLTNKT